MNLMPDITVPLAVSAGCHINDVMNTIDDLGNIIFVSAGCHINDVMNLESVVFDTISRFSWMSYQ